MQTIEITLPKPLDWQRQVMSEAKRFNVVCLGRRSGKTELGKILMAQPRVLNGYAAGWFAPNYSYLMEVWRDINAIFAPLITKSNFSEKRIELMTGAVLEFWTLDNPRAGRSRKYNRVIIDEAAFVRYLADLWNMAILPTLADYKGDAWILSTPKGRNDFYRLWQNSNSREDWQAWQMPTMVNPHIAQSEIDQMRENMPERAYMQEIEAVFLEDGGGVFRNVANCVYEDEPNRLYNHDYVIGVDWGKLNDFTVITVLNTNTKQIVEIDRFNQIDYTVQKGRLTALCNRYNVVGVIAESNSMGEPLIDDLKRQGLPMRPFLTTNASKTNAIDALSLAFEQQQIQIPNNETLIAELLAYEAERLQSGLMRYGAPDGMHDDMVMSLAMAWQGVAKVYAPPSSTKYR